VLVIDDDATVREMMERLLAKEGYKVVAASRGLEGLRLAREIRPAAITLDIVMPDVDGWTVLAALKGDPDLADIPVVVVTIVDDRSRGRTLGAADYMVKPIDRDRLAKVLGALRGDGRGARVLIVEDDETTRQMIRQILQAQGFTVSEAANGRVALEGLSADAPDVILLDLLMPEMDGFEFLEALHANAAWRQIPVLVLTAMDLTGQDLARLSGSVQRVLQKGACGPEELRREIRDCLAARIGSRA
jgi:CheY-like chemotaxis protein